MMVAGPYPTKAKFQSLETQVGGLQTASVPRLREGGADIVQQISTNNTETQNFIAAMVRPLTLQYDTREERDMSELRLQVPESATVVPTITVKGARSGTLVPLSGNPAYIVADGARWLSIPLRYRLTYDMSESLRVEFGAAYPLLIGQPSEQNMQVDFEGQTGPNTYASAVIGVRFVCAGPRTITGRLMPDAFPMVATPTPNLPDGAVELILAEPPYLRTMYSGVEYRLPFVQFSDGGAG